MHLCFLACSDCESRCGARWQRGAWRVSPSAWLHDFAMQALMRYGMARLAVWCDAKSEGDSGDRGPGSRHARRGAPAVRGLGTDASRACGHQMNSGLQARSTQCPLALLDCLDSAVGGRCKGPLLMFVILPCPCDRVKTLSIVAAEHEAARAGLLLCYVILAESSGPRRCRLATRSCYVVLNRVTLRSVCGVIMTGS